MKKLTTICLFTSLLLCPITLLAKSDIENAEEAYEKRQFRQAISYYQRAIAADTATPQAKLNLVRAYMATQRLPAATRLLDELANDYNYVNNVDYMELQGDVARQSSNWQTARHWYNQALKKQPASEATQATLLLKLGQALQQLGDKEGATAVFAKYVRLTGVSQ